MKKIILTSALLLAGFTYCQDDAYTEPKDSATGTSAEDAAKSIFALDLSVPGYLNANLARGLAASADWQVENGELKPVAPAGTYAEEAGADADLLNGVGFGTYLNPDQHGEATAWDQLSDYGSVINAGIKFATVGDSIKICRSFATTCATFTATDDETVTVSTTMAANLPELEYSDLPTEYQQLLSAQNEELRVAIRNVGPDGLTIALADTSVTQGTYAPGGSIIDKEITVKYSIKRNGLDLGDSGVQPALLASIEVDGDEVITEFNSFTALGASIKKSSGVAIQWELPADASIDAVGDGTEMLGAGSAHLPLFMYLENDPANTVPAWAAYNNYPANNATEDVHVVQDDDGAVGASASVIEANDDALNPVTERTVTVASKAYDSETGGFSIPPSLCFMSVFGKDTDDDGTPDLMDSDGDSGAGTDLAINLATTGGNLAALQGTCNSAIDTDANFAGIKATLTGSGATNANFCVFQGNGVDAVRSVATAQFLADELCRDGLSAAGLTPQMNDPDNEGINLLVLGGFGLFIDQAFGQSVPASNFSLMATNGDDTGENAPSITSLTISKE